VAAAKKLVARESFICEHEGRKVLVPVGTRLPPTSSSRSTASSSRPRPSCTSPHRPDHAVANGVVTGRGSAFWRELEDVHGPAVADSVRLASLPIDERIRILEHRVAEIDRRLEELRHEDREP
jgi:hypothetical protein